MKTTTSAFTVQRCQVKPSRASGSGYIVGRIYEWAGTCRSMVEITDSVERGRVSYVSNECFDRNFTQLPE